MKSRDLNQALAAFRQKGGTLRTRDLIEHGVHTDALYALRKSGRVVLLARGLYRLADAKEAEHPDLEEVLSRTLGVPLFQEQLIRMAMIAAGGPPHLQEA